MPEDGGGLQPPAGDEVDGDDGDCRGRHHDDGTDGVGGAVAGAPGRATDGEARTQVAPIVAAGERAVPGTPRRNEATGHAAVARTSTASTTRLLSRGGATARRAASSHAAASAETTTRPTKRLTSDGP